MLARVVVVGLAHLVLLMVVAHMTPELRKELTPVLVSLIPSAPPPHTPPPPPPPIAPRLVAPSKAPAPKPKPAVTAPEPAIPPTSTAIASETPPAVSAPVAMDTPAAKPEPAAAPTASPAPVIAELKPSAPLPVVPPRFDAAYLNNPAPEYPRVARRMGEHGKVVLRVYVNTAGAAEKVEVRTSSGYTRLDQAAREAVERWKFVPARQGGDAVGAWVLVPITFVLEG